MPRYSDADFDKFIGEEFAKTPLGAVAIKDYVAIVDPVTGDPTRDNAFVVSYTQRDEAPGGVLAHTRVDIRGADGLIHTSYECDHVAHEPIPDTDGEVLLADVGAVDPDTKEPVLFDKGADLTEPVRDELTRLGVTKVPIRLRPPSEVATIMTPLLEAEQVISVGTDADGQMITAAFTPAELAARSEFEKALRGGR